MKYLISASLISVVVFLFFASPDAWALQCPAGSHPWVDNYGNDICKSFGSGRTIIKEGSLDNCPTGTHLWVDNWGNRICKNFKGNQKYYDTSKGCPIGTYEWVGKWGNRVCKRF